MSNQNDFLGRIQDNWRQRAGEHTTFRSELRLVPRVAFKMLAALYLVAITFVVSLAFINPKGIGSPLAPKVLFIVALVTAAGVALTALVSLFCYIAVDAKRRGMSPVLWVLVALLVPYLIGVILYFVLREPLPMECPQCGRAVNPHFNFCPGCQFNLRPNCPQCRRAVRAGDRFCPHCGAALEAELTVPAGASEA